MGLYGLFIETYCRDCVTVKCRNVFLFFLFFCVNVGLVCMVVVFLQRELHMYIMPVVDWINWIIKMALHTNIFSYLL